MVATPDHPYDNAASWEIVMRSLLVALLLNLTVGSPPATAQSPAQQVRSAIVEMNRAAAKSDADEFMRHYWRSDDLAITFDGETMRGWQRILQEQRKWWADKRAGTTFGEQRAPEIVVQGSGVATTIQWMSVSSARSEKPAQLVITSVWKKLPEGWRIVLAHETLRP